MRGDIIPPKIIIDQNLCIGCLKCVRSCPAEILIQEKDEAIPNKRKKRITVINSQECFECRACEVVCPVNAIQVYWLPKQDADVVLLQK